MKTGVKLFWDAASEEYADRQWSHGNIARFDYRQTKKALLRHLAPAKKERILEIGCGSGTWTQIIAPLCKELIAVDLSERMLGKARRSVAGKNVRFLCCDFTDARLHGKFDKVFSVRAIEYVGNKERAMQKIQSLLKPGGKIVVVTKTRPCLWDVARKVPGFWQEKISFKNFSRILRKCGFASIMVEPVVLRLPIFAGGNRELPIVPRRYEQSVLRLFEKLTGVAQGRSAPFFTMLSESYIISGVRHKA